MINGLQTVVKSVQRWRRSTARSVYLAVAALAAGMLLCSPVSEAAIAFDAASVIDGGSSTSSMTWSHTVTSAGSGRILIVGVAINNWTSQTVSSVTYGGVSMTLVPGGTATRPLLARAELWYLTNPPTGANNVVVTLSANANVRAGATSYTGVNQTTPLGTASGAQDRTSTATVNVSSAAGELVVDAIAMESTSATIAVGANQTPQYQSDTGGTNIRTGGSTEAGAATVTMSWTISVTKDWAIVAVPLKPTAAAGPLNNFLLEAEGGGSVGTQTAGTPFSIRITARDTSNNTVTSFTGTVNITSTGTLSAGGGTTAAFTAGVLVSHSVTISNTGSFTITATNTAGAEAGTSNAFTVNAGATVSSAASQSFTVGQASTTASTLTVTDSSVATITAAQDIRIRIPAAFNMTWDPAVTTVTLGGGAAGKVSATLLAYEDSNKTAVLNVTTNFAASDQVTIAGLKFANFTVASGPSNLQLVVAGAGGATAATDDKTITIVAVSTATLSSAANQTFTVGQASTAAITLTVTDGSTATITAAQDLRIRIPAALNMTWDPAVTTVTLGGGAAGKVSATLLAYEDGNKTAVLNVTTNFAANDQLTIAGLKFTSFTAVSAASSLQLVVAGAGGATAATDDKTITIVAVATLSSAANQTFNVGQASATASTLTVTDSSTPTITTTQEIRIRIPASLGMTWDTSVTSITRGGTASGKVSATLLAYEDGNKTAVVNVTTNFAASDTLTIAGLKFTNFTAISAHNLQLVVTGTGGVTTAIDDKTITINSPLGVSTGTTIAGCVAPGGGVVTIGTIASASFGGSSGNTYVNVTGVALSGQNAVVVIVGYNNIADQTVTSAVIDPGGANITIPYLADSNNTRSGSDDAHIYLFGLVNPPQGTYTVRVNFNATLSSSTGINVVIYPLSGVDTTTPFRTPGTAENSTSASSVTVPSAAGDLVLAGVTGETLKPPTLTSAGIPDANIYGPPSCSGSPPDCSNHLATAHRDGAVTSVNFSWSHDNDHWATAGVSVKPAPASLTSLTLPSWTPQSGELLLVGISMRDETISHSVTGNGLTWTLVADRDNDRAEMGVALYRASGASPTTGSIVIDLPGNTLPAYAVAVRLSNVDTAVNQGIEAVATASGPAASDNRNMKVTVTTLTANAMALAWGGQRGSATLSLPAGETVIDQSSADCGTSPDQMRGHMWRENVATPGPTQLGQDNSLSTAQPWAIIGVSIKPLPPTPPQPPGRFNVFESSTVAGALTGVIRTKIAGNAVAVDVIALNSSRTAVDTAFTGTVKVEVLNASNNTGALDGNGCRSTWTVIQTLSNPTFAAGDNGRKTVSFTEANSYRDVRLRVSYPTTSPTQIGCSNDNFAIRPSTFANFAVSDGNDWQTAGTSRALTSTTFAAVTHKAGRPMSVRATAVNAVGTTATTNYTGAPVATLSACGGAACTASFGTLTLASTFAAGQLSTDIASYNDVGSFALQLVDSTYASVDAGDTVGACTASGSYACSATINVGRFVPNHFAVSLNTATFASACGSFSYLGQKFSYSTTPVITVTAQGFANNTTTLYENTWWRITNASLTGKAYTTATGTFDTSGLPGTDPVIFAAGSGAGSLTFSSGTGLFFTRTTPVAPFDAEISLAINVIDADGVSYASNPARFGQASAGNGIAFSTGKPMRFGRFAIRNANGSQLVPLLVRVEAQYWSGAPTNAFITNTLDNCTLVASANYAMGNYTGNLSGSPTCETAISGGGTLSAGRGTLVLAKPGVSNDGSVNLTVNLGAAASGSTCTTQGAAPVSATTANLPHLQGNWTGANYDQNPTARATFGVFKGSEEVIFVRENF